MVPVNRLYTSQSTMCWQYCRRVNLLTSSGIASVISLVGRRARTGSYRRRRLIHHQFSCHPEQCASSSPEHRRTRRMKQSRSQPGPVLPDTWISAQALRWLVPTLRFGNNRLQYRVSLSVILGTVKYSIKFKPLEAHGKLRELQRGHT